MSRAADRDGAGLSAAAGRGLLERYAALGRFSGVALVARAGQLVWSQALGQADRASARALAEDSRFALGSLSKQFTAAAVLRLHQAGDLDLAAPIACHLGDLGLPFAGVVTAQQLLEHRSGIPSLFKPHLGIALSDERAAQPASRAELCDVFRNLPLRFTPGDRIEYSNSGYALLAMLVERVSGLSWDDYLATRLLGPAGLTRTSTAPEVGDAGGYLAGRRMQRAHPSWLLGSGDLIGPAHELATWAFATGSPGLAAQQRRGRRVLHHDGALAGFVTTYHHLPDDDLVVVVLTNSVPGWTHVPLATRTVNQLADQLADLALGGEPMATPPAVVPRTRAELERCTGRYLLEGGLEIEIRRENDSLWALTRGPRPWTFWGVGALAGLATTPRGQRARALLDALEQQRFDDALALFAPENARLLSPGTLAELWQALCHKTGATPAFQLIQVHDDVAYLRASTMPPLDAVIAFDAADQVVGFHVVAPGVGPASPMVELVPTDAGLRFLADGYRFAMVDFELSFECTSDRAEALVIHLGQGYRAVRRGAP